jgi:3-oxoacyl-[acyl-carrier protein] reductase
MRYCSDGVGVTVSFWGFFYANLYYFWRIRRGRLCALRKTLTRSITGVASCIGSLLLKPLHLTALAEFEATMQVNVGTSFAILRSAVKAMQGTGGSIVLCSSAVSEIGMANHEAIAAAKGAINALARSAAATYASKKIRVNVVAPGLTKTPLTARITGSEAAVKASLAMHPLGRLGEPEDIARAISFFLDPANDWITGQILAVDGGLSALKVKTD